MVRQGQAEEPTPITSFLQHQQSWAMANMYESPVLYGEGGGGYIDEASAAAYYAQQMAGQYPTDMVRPPPQNPGAQTPANLCDRFTQQHTPGNTPPGSPVLSPSNSPGQYADAMMGGGWQLSQPAEPSTWTNSGHRKSYPLDPFDDVDLSTWEAIKECGATKRPNQKKSVDLC